MAKRNAEPKTRAAIIASGLVTVIPPSQVTRWDYKCGPSDFTPLCRSERAELRRARSSALPKWLRPVERITLASLPGGRAPGWYNGYGSFTSGHDREFINRAGRERLYCPELSDWLDGRRLKRGDIAIPSGAWWEQRSIKDMTPSQLDAELDRQARRLANGWSNANEDDDNGED